MRLCLVLGALFGLVSCGPSFGTGTGNPAQMGAPGDDTNHQPPSASVVVSAEGLRDELCRAVKACHANVTVERCTSEIPDVAGMGAKLGLTTTPDLNLGLVC